jgi:hypothetical protein
MHLLLAALCLTGPEVVREPDGLGSAFRKLASGEYTPVVWFGGFITALGGRIAPQAK